jgi:hypothetical protein
MGLDNDGQVVASGFLTCCRLSFRPDQTLGYTEARLRIIPAVDKW